MFSKKLLTFCEHWSLSYRCRLCRYYKTPKAKKENILHTNLKNMSGVFGLVQDIQITHCFNPKTFKAFNSD